MWTRTSARHRLDITACEGSAPLVRTRTVEKLAEKWSDVWPMSDVSFLLFGVFLVDFALRGVVCSGT